MKRILEDPQANLMLCPTTVDKLNLLNHEQTVLLLTKYVPLLTSKTIASITKQREDDDEYPLNALTGSHLVNAIQTYTIEHSPMEGMATQLMKNDKITNEDVALSVSGWLVETYCCFKDSSSYEKETKFKKQCIHKHVGSPSIIDQPPPLEGNLFEWLETYLNVNLKRSFEALLDQPYKPPEQAIQGFYNREEFQFRIKELVNKNLSHFHTNKKGAVLRKNGFLFGTLTNGTGNGKSRACNEIQNIIVNMKVEQYENMTSDIKYRKIHSYISLDNGSTITSVEASSIDPKKEITEGKIVGMRLLAKVLGMGTDIFVKKLGIHFTHIFNTAFFTLENIVRKFKEFLCENEILIWSISFDEVQNLERFFGDNWKATFYAIGKFMVNTESVNEN